MPPRASSYVSVMHLVLLGDTGTPHRPFISRCFHLLGLSSIIRLIQFAESNLLDYGFADLSFPWMRHKLFQKIRVDSLYFSHLALSLAGKDWEVLSENDGNIVSDFSMIGDVNFCIVWLLSLIIYLSFEIISSLIAVSHSPILRAAIASFSSIFSKSSCIWAKNVDNCFQWVLLEFSCCCCLLTVSVEGSLLE